MNEFASQNRLAKGTDSQHQRTITLPGEFGSGRRGISILTDDKSTEVYKQQLSIAKSFGANDSAQEFCVCDPRKAPKGDHSESLVIGEDKSGPLDVRRRYKEFNLLRQVLY